MAEKKKVALKALLDVKRFLPAPADLLKPLPAPKQGDMVMQGITADVLSWAVGHIPTVGDIIGAFINDNIMADVQARLSPAERTEFREQNRVYPNGIALLRTFQRVRLSPESRP